MRSARPGLRERVADVLRGAGGGDGHRDPVRGAGSPGGGPGPRSGREAPAGQRRGTALSFSSETARSSSRGQRAPQQVGEDVGVALAVEARALAPRPAGQAAAGHELREGLGVQRHVVHQRPVEVEHHARAFMPPARGRARDAADARQRRRHQQRGDGVEDDRRPLARPGLEDEQQAEHADAGGGAAQEAEDLGGAVGAVAELARDVDGRGQTAEQPLAPRAVRRGRRARRSALSEEDGARGAG